MSQPLRRGAPSFWTGKRTRGHRKAQEISPEHGEELLSGTPGEGKEAPSAGIFQNHLDAILRRGLWDGSGLAL